MSESRASLEPSFSNTPFGRLRNFFSQASDRALLGLFIVLLSGGLFVCLLTVYLIGFSPFQVTQGDSDNSNTNIASNEPALSSNHAVSVNDVAPNANGLDTTIQLDTGLETNNFQIPSPIRVVLNDQIIPISSQTIGASELLNSAIYEDVHWLQNSVVNYVFQLPNTAVYQNMLQSLALGDTIELYGSLGDVKSFVVEEILDEAPNPDTFRQNEPAITLIWPGDAPRIVRGQFAVSEDEAIVRTAQSAVSLGETAVIGDAALTVRHTIQNPDASNIPVGFTLYQIEVELQNNGAESLDTGWFNFVLIDDSGNQYLNQQAIAFSQILEAGQGHQQTAAFQIPTNLATTGFNLAVSRIDGPATLNIKLPYSPPAVQTNQIDLLDAQLSPDNTRLLLTGEVRNLGVQPLTIQASDLSLQNQGEYFLIFETTPPLPWTIQPGTTQPFLLNTQRPDVSTVTVHILDQRFALQNLR